MAFSLLCVWRVVMAEFIEFEVDEDEVMRGLDIQEQLGKRFLRDFIDDLADKGVELLERHAPEYTTYTKRHIDRESVRWLPGGAGGGGAYEVVLGVKAGTSYHPVYANVGTGLYGQYGDWVQSPTGRLMYFYSQLYGHVISKYVVAGQRPQQFLYHTWRDLEMFAVARMLVDTRGRI
jgi:hypothetical protein